MSEQSPKDLGAAANLLLVAVLLAIVGTGVIVLADQRSRGGGHPNHGACRCFGSACRYWPPLNRGQTGEP
jgi:hypothetical protein